MEREDASLEMGREELVIKITFIIIAIKMCLYIFCEGKECAKELLVSAEEDENTVIGDYTQPLGRDFLALQCQFSFISAAE